MEYRPLNAKKNEIRVLKILPLASSPKTKGQPEIPASSDIVHCELRHVSLDDYTPQYFAFKPEYVRSTKELLLKWKSRDPPKDSHLSIRQRISLLRNLKNRMTARLSFSQESFDKSITPRYVWGDYIALSYTWGDQPAHETILLNGFETKPCPARGFVLWVDALSINQSDLRERAQQVKRMRNIYGQAWTVVVWLGESDTESNTALDVIHNIHKSLGGDKGAKEGLLEALLREPWFDLQSVYHFVGREYWWRVWIIQELAMGHAEMPLLCGQSRIHWAAFGEVVEFLLHKIEMVARSIPSRSSRQFRRRLVRIQKMLRLSEGEEQFPGKGSLTAMLELSQESKASDARDKIYGLLGLMYSHLAEMVVPDYKLDTTKVYTDFSKAIVGGLYGLDHIYRGNRSMPRKFWPSWVYDFRAESDRDYLDHEIPFEACFGALAFGPIRDDSLHIFCSGIWIDTVDQICLPPLIESSQLGISDEIPIDLLEALWRTLCFDAKHSLFAPTTEVSWQSTVLGIPWCIDELCANTNMDEVESLGWSSVYHSEYFSAFDRFRRANRVFRIRGYHLEHFFAPDLYPLLDPAPLIQSLKRMMTAMFGRRLVSTENGQPGLGVLNTLPGDKIFVVMGCNMPLLLRPQGSHFEVVGEVYYHGVMYGEAMVLIEQDSSRLASITLC